MESSQVIKRVSKIIHNVLLDTMLQIYKPKFSLQLSLFWKPMKHQISLLVNRLLSFDMCLIDKLVNIFGLFLSWVAIKLRHEQTLLRQLTINRAINICESPTIMTECQLCVVRKMVSSHCEKKHFHKPIIYIATNINLI